MKPLSRFLFAGLALLSACGSHPSATFKPADSTHTRKDSMQGANDDQAAIKAFNPTDYQFYARRNLGIYSIILFRHKEAALSDPPRPFLILKNTRSGKTDTLAMGAIETLGEARDFGVIDVSRQLGGDKPSFLVDWQGESDNIYEELIGYADGRLKELLNLPIVGGLHDLKRIDDHTLEGTYSDRDELVAWTHGGYRLRISLPDYTTTTIAPDTLILDVDSEARDTIQTTRILPGSPQGIPYTILPGTPLHIDTFFRKAQIVRLHIDDSIFIRARFEDVQFKVRGDDAG